MKTIQLKYSRFFAMAPLSMAIVLPDGRILKANRSFADEFQAEAEALVRTSLLHLLPGEVHSETRALLAGSGGVLDLSRNGKTSHRMRFIPDEEYGQYYVWVEAATEAQETTADQDLRERVRIYENIIQNNWDAVFFSSMDGQIQFINKAAARLYGYRPDELIGQNISIIHVESEEQTREMMEALRNTGAYQGTVRHQKKDRSDIQCLLHVSMVFNGDGQPLGLYASCKDVTRDLQVESLLEQEDTRSEQDRLLQERLRVFQNIIENNWDGIVFSDLTGKILFANRQAARLYGYRSDELVGRNIDIFNAPENTHAGEMVQALKEVGGWSAEILHRRKDESQFHVLYTVSMIFDRDGHPTGLVSTSKDITERVIAELEAKEKTDELIRMKDSFLHRLETQVEERTSELNAEKEKTDELLLNVLPRETAHELKTKGAATPMHYDRVSILFADFAGFTRNSEQLQPAELIQVLGYYFSNFDEIVARCGIEKIKTIGDAYMCAGGVPVANETSAADAVRAALELQDFMGRVDPEILAVQKNAPWRLRIGIHTGPVVAGVVGKQRFAYDIWGDAVNVASRMESSGEPGRINVSEATYRLMADAFECEHRGKIEVKSIGPVEMFFVNGARLPS